LEVGRTDREYDLAAFLSGAMGRAMYRNSLTPSKFFALALLLFSATGALIWFTSLVDSEAPAFDTGGLILLGATVALLILSLLFQRRVRWVRVIMSILLHVLAVGLLVTLLSIVPAVETLTEKMMAVAFALLGAGLLFVMILILHGNAMRTDFATARERVRRPHGRTYVVGAMSCMLLLLTLAAWRIVPLLVAQPTVTVDYLAQANQANKPADYDPNRNAAPYYEKLFSQFTPLPQSLKDSKAWRSWPGDLSDDQLKTVEGWASANASTLPTLAEAARCPYWWF
jgi:hypothetical protein